MSNDDRVFVSESAANRAAQRLEEEIYSGGQWVDVDEVGEDKFEVKVHDIVHQRVFNEGDNPATDWEGGKDFPIYVSRYWRHNQEDEFWDDRLTWNDTTHSSEQGETHARNDETDSTVNEDILDALRFQLSSTTYKRWSSRSRQAQVSYVERIVDTRSSLVSPTTRRGTLPYVESGRGVLRSSGTRDCNRNSSGNTSKQNEESVTIDDLEKAAEHVAESVRDSFRMMVPSDTHQALRREAGLPVSGEWDKVREEEFWDRRLPCA